MLDNATSYRTAQPYAGRAFKREEEAQQAVVIQLYTILHSTLSLPHRFTQLKSNLLATFFPPASSNPSNNPLFLFLVAAVSSGGNARGTSSAVGLGSLEECVGRGVEENQGWNRACDSGVGSAVEHKRERVVTGRIEKIRSTHLLGGDAFPWVVGEEFL